MTFEKAAKQLFHIDSLLEDCEQVGYLRWSQSAYDGQVAFLLIKYNAYGDLVFADCAISRQYPPNKLYDWLQHRHYSLDDPFISPARKDEYLQSTKWVVADFMTIARLIKGDA